MFQTRHNRVAGIGNTKGSQRAMNLLFAIRDIQLRTGRDLGATFLSGTVVVNALTEQLYHYSQFQGSLWILVLHVRSPVLLFPALAFSIPFLYTSIYRFSAAVQPAVD